MDIISCKNLNKKYKNFESLKDISFTVKNKGCIGFLGPNGAGKTTTIRILTGLAKATSGEVKINGFDVNKDMDKIQMEIGYCPQAPVFYNYMTAMEWMLWVSKSFNIPKNEATERAIKLLKLCGIYDAKDREIGGFSGGMKQRLGIAQALINNPKLLILDEPVSALDPQGRYDVLSIIESLKNEMTIFMSTHILEDIERVADELVIINHGVVILNGTLEEIRHNYTEPIIEITLNNPNLTFTDRLNKEAYITKVDLIGNDYKIYTNNYKLATTNLLKILVECNASVKSYNLGSSNLEEIFLKVVKSA
ncbi:MAG: ATP-binding cassette domain-containing protein [Clostridium sp.]